MITMSCSRLKCRMFCWLFTFALTNAEKNKGRIWAEDRSSWDGSRFAQRMCNSAASLAVIVIDLFALMSSFLLVLGKAGLRNDVRIMDKILMFLSMLRCYIDGGALKVVGEGKGQPDGGWEWKQDGIRSERYVCFFLLLLLLDKD